MKKVTGKYVVEKPKKELRPILKAKKEEFEKKGWVFDQDADELWFAKKTVDGKEIYRGNCAYLSALLAWIEGDETGDHQPGKYAEHENL